MYISNIYHQQICYCRKTILIQANSHSQKCESETEDEESSTTNVKREIKQEAKELDANNSLNITTAHGEHNPKDKIKNLA